jgi:hypothetical protein
MDPIDETTDGPDLAGAQRSLADARAGSKRTEEVVREANAALMTLRGWHKENHFVDKLRVAIRGVPS